MRRIKAPCPGCGDTDLYREKDKVCPECSRLLGRVKEIEKKEKSGENNLIGVRFGERYHWNQYIYTRGDFESEKIVSAFHRLALASSVHSLNSEANFNEDIILLGKIEGGAVRFLMNKEIAESIRDLRNMIQPLIDSAYARGKEDGHNLLMRLASGDLSPNEYLKNTKEKS